MTIGTQLSLIWESWRWRKPLSFLMNGAHKFISEGFW